MHETRLPTWAIERGRAMRSRPRLDPATTAIVSIDLQNFFMAAGFPMANPHALDIVPNVNALTATLRRLGGAVIFLQHSMRGREDGRPGGVSSGSARPMGVALHGQLVPGDPAFDLHSELTIAVGDIRLTKRTPSGLHARAESGLLEILVERGIRTVIATGLVTNGCCDSLARDAYQHGFGVVVATDACAAMTDEEHNAALLNLAICFADVIPSGAIIAGLEAGA